MLQLFNFHQHVAQVSRNVQMLQPGRNYEVHHTKSVKLIKHISSHIFCSIDTKLATLHLQTVLHKPSRQIFELSKIEPTVHQNVLV